MILVDWTLPDVVIECKKCDRRGAYKHARLLEKYGPDKDMFMMRCELSASCTGSENKDLCSTIYPDAMRVQDMMADKKAAA